MNNKLLEKGLELELYGGTKSGEVMPLAKKLMEKFSFISSEPDQRNFEFITNPHRSYEELYKEITSTKVKIREYLKELGGFTLIPGSTMPLAFSKDLYSSSPDDEYKEWILKQYKTKVITTSLHLNIGFDNYEHLFKVLCLLKLYTPIFLALSASSCFYDGKITKYNSFRWHSFPHAPKLVPFFTNHSEYASWINEKLATKEMHNIRHLWTSIRPNGPDRPNKLNRIEIRICDLVSDTKKALSILALIETIAQKYLAETNWPKILTSDLSKLAETIERQENVVAKDGLNAKIWDWENDKEDTVYNIVERLYINIKEIADLTNITPHLNPLVKILEDDNEASQFMNMYNKNGSIQKTMEHFIEQFTIKDFASINTSTSK